MLASRLMALKKGALFLKDEPVSNSIIKVQVRDSETNDSGFGNRTSSKFK
jgi:hypothetical protein